MLIIITAKFSGTESAQQAARRISEKCGDIYELRLYYDTIDEDFGTKNNILYHAQNEFLPYMAAQNVTRQIPLGKIVGEVREECLMKVIISNRSADMARSIIYNEGGFDVLVSEE